MSLPKELEEAAIVDGCGRFRVFGQIMLPLVKPGIVALAIFTIKFAWKRFDLKRIYNNLLYIKSPYNTYRNPGLPPGPIRIPSIAGIDAVLNHVQHDYLYMCAKEDFSGTHNFARNYNEHLQNAKRYSDALNDRGIK